VGVANQPKSWQKARESCKSYGGDLLSITDAQDRVCPFCLGCFIIGLYWTFQNNYFFSKTFYFKNFIKISNVNRPKSVKILSPWCKVREKIGKKSVIFTDFDFDFLIFHGHKI
jgi:hypothetical protein